MAGKKAARTFEEQMKRLDEELQSIEEKRQMEMMHLEERKKKVMERRRSLEQSERKKQEKKMIAAYVEQFGKVTEQNLEIFLRFVAENKNQLATEMGIQQVEEMKEADVLYEHESTYDEFRSQ